MIGRINHIFIKMKFQLCQSIAKRDSQPAKIIMIGQKTHGGCV